MPTFLTATLRRLSSVATWLATLLAGLLLVVFIGWVTLPRILNLQAVIVLTGSMEPDLPVGSVAFVSKTGATNVETGDVITFYRPGQAKEVLITHRVVDTVSRSSGPVYFTRGDRNDTVDDWEVPASLVVGEVGTVVPYVGYVTEKVRGRNGFLALMVIPGALIIIGELNKIRRELHTWREERSPT